MHLFQAIRAGAERDHIAEAFHLLNAKKWNLSHSVVVQHIAADAVVNGTDSFCCTILAVCCLNMSLGTATLLPGITERAIKTAP